MTLTAQQININDNSSYTTLLDLFHPVGSLYFSLEDINPCAFLGGTWVKIEGGLLAAAGNEVVSGNTYVYGAPNNQIPGRSGTGFLQTSNLPSHAHTIPKHGHGHSLSVVNANFETSEVAAHSHGLNDHKHGMTHNHYLNVNGKTDGTGFVAGFYADSTAAFNAVSGSRAYPANSGSQNTSYYVSSVSANTAIHGAKANTTLNSAKTTTDGNSGNTVEAGKHKHTLNHGHSVSGSITDKDAFSTENTGGGSIYIPRHIGLFVWQRTN